MKKLFFILFLVHPAGAEAGHSEGEGKPVRSDEFLSEYIVDDATIQHWCFFLSKAPIDKMQVQAPDGSQGDGSACVAHYGYLRDYAKQIKDLRSQCATDIAKLSAAECDQKSCDQRDLAVVDKQISCRQVLAQMEKRASDIENGFRPYFDRIVKEINLKTISRKRVQTLLHVPVDK